MATFTWPPLSLSTSSGPIQFTKNSVTTTVTQDTGTPANSIPLPVSVLGTNGVAVDPATAANQSTEISKLTSLDTKLPAQGQALAGASLPVVLPAAQITTLTPPTTVTVTQATGTNLHAVVDSSALPTGASTSALQTSGNSSLTSIDGKTPALGQALAGASVPVVLPAAQITTLTPPTTVTVTQATGSNLHVAVDSSALPTGASTETTLSAVNTKLAGTITTAEVASSTATITSVASSATTVSLLALNAARKMATVYNESTSILYIAFAGTASLTAYTVQVPAGGYYELPSGKVYTGAISGIWSAANGNARITELS